MQLLGYKPSLQADGKWLSVADGTDNGARRFKSPKGRRKVDFRA